MSPPELRSYSSQIRPLFLFFLYVALDKCCPGELSEINFICSLITEHVLRCISHNIPSPPTILSFSKLFWGDIWLSVTLVDMCLKTVSLLSLSRLSSLCLLPPSLSNQKAKPCRRLRANNKSLPCGCLKMTERPERQQRKCTLIFPGLEANITFFFFNISDIFCSLLYSSFFFLSCTEADGLFLIQDWA